MRWGFPQYTGKGLFINARSETAANSSMISVHDRMPLILEQGEVSDWIYNVDAARKYLNKVPLALKQEREYEQQSLFKL